MTTDFDPDEYTWLPYRVNLTNVSDFPFRVEMVSGDDRWRTLSVWPDLQKAVRAMMDAVRFGE